MENVQKKESTQ